MTSCWLYIFLSRTFLFRNVKYEFKEAEPRDKELYWTPEVQYKLTTRIQKLMINPFTNHRES